MADHSAAGSAVGYLYQCELALYELARRARRNDDIALFLEVLDDIHLQESGKPADLLQAKHNLGPAGNLSDASTDLWRTIRAWIDTLERVGSSKPRRVLLTTAIAAKGTAAAALREDLSARNENEAERLLCEIAETSTNKGTEKARRAFLKLEEAQRSDFIASILVLDGQPGICELDTAIIEEIRFACSTRNETQLLERLKGWWYRQAVALLTKQIDSVTTDTFKKKMDDLREQFDHDNLPTDIDPGEPIDENDTTAMYAKMFVKQLELIMTPRNLVAIMIRSYYRAYRQRSKWARDGLVRPGELERFENRLIDEWREKFEWMKADLEQSCAELEKEGCEESEKQSKGRELLRNLPETSRARLRPKYDEEFLTKGTFHSLADDLKVGWHSDFLERLQSWTDRAIPE